MSVNTASSSPHPPREQIGSLTGLRFVAAIYVFLFHFGAGFLKHAGAPPRAIKFLENGYLGVSLFFVLSGFILTYTYRRGVQSLPDFAVARFARIYPVYILALLIALPYVYMQLDLLEAVKVLAMVQSWTWYGSTSGNTWVTQAWTLSVEAVFYISFPALIIQVNRLSRLGLIVSTVLISSVILAIGPQALSPGALRPDLPIWMQVIPLPLLRLPEFIFGMLICKFFLDKKAIDRDGQSLWTDVAIWLTVILIGAILSSNEKENFRTLACVTLLFGLLIYLLSIGKTLIARSLSGHFLQALGGASYALYLIQAPIRLIVKTVIPQDSIGQIVNPIVLIAASLAAYYWIEKPCRRKILSISSYLNTHKRGRGGPAELSRSE